MSEIQFRRIAFEFDDAIPFHFNPGNPGASHFVNLLSLVAPGFERYVIRVIRGQMERIEDERVREDAKLFCAQEGHHARVHADHAKMLIGRHPGLAAARDRIIASYDALFDARDVDFHLAYAATVELFFGPSARFIVEQRDVLFGGGDARIGSFVLWHFVEEFEHRNCAIDVYRALGGSWGHRMRCLPAVLRHLGEIGGLAQQGLDRLADQGLESAPRDSVVAGIPVRAQARFGAEMARTLLPWHRPDDLQEPEWSVRWRAEHAAGRDMRRYYESPA